MAEWNVQYTKYSTIHNTMYHIIMSADIQNGRIFSVRMSHRYWEWFTGIYLGVKLVHPRVSKSIRTQLRTSDTRYIQNSYYTVSKHNYQKKYRQ